MNAASNNFTELGVKFVPQSSNADDFIDDDQQSEARIAALVHPIELSQFVASMTMDSNDQAVVRVETSRFENRN